MYGNGGCAVTGYRPMTLADLAGRLAREADDRIRWKLVWEFLEEYRREPDDAQPALLRPCLQVHQDGAPHTSAGLRDQLAAAMQVSD
jgi:hypothetical protein